MSELELSVVIPALDEERTIAHCVGKALKALTALKVSGEVVVADNGSADRTREVAASLGARVVPVEGKGYGLALRGGFAAARGRFLLMADADGSYDFEECGPYLEKLRAGSDLVVGNRFKGVIAPGAMPFLHRYLGTPVLTAIMNLLFGAGLGDTNCGMRALRRDAFERMGLKADGMEFATEMLVKASLVGLKISEVPCNLYKDLRDRPPHLRTWRDGWRHLRFMLLFSPMGTFFFPGAFCAGVGFLGLIGLTTRDLVFRETLGWLTSRHMLTSLLFWLVGIGALGLGVVAQEADYQERYDARNRLIAFLHRTFSLEKGLILGAALILLGGAVLAYLPVSYYGRVFPRGSDTLRLDAAILAIASVLTGIQCVFVSFALGLFYHRVK